MLKDRKKLMKLTEITLLLIIFSLAFYVRVESVVPDRILSYDPVYQYRFTKYFVQWGFFPDWDELSYYVGRKFYMPPLMFYVTGIIYKVLLKLSPFLYTLPFEWFKNMFGHMTLKTAASLSATFYGALIAISAYLLGKELSNGWGGVLSAALVSFSPQILIRTFGASYDTDQLVLFFILLTLWAGIRLFKKPNIYNFFVALFSFTAFMLTWNMFWYTFFIYVAIIGGYYYISIIKKLYNEKRFVEILILIISPVILYALMYISFAGFFLFSSIFVLVLFYYVFSILDKKQEILNHLLYSVALFVSLVAIGILEKLAVIKWLFDIIGFATKPEVWIVNISIAELQPIGLNIGALIKSFGGYVFNYFYLDIGLLLLFISVIIFQVTYMRKKDEKQFSAILVLTLFAFLTVTRGIRFTEYSSAILLTLVSSGFIYLHKIFSKERVFQHIITGIIISLFFLSSTIALQYGPNLGPDMDKNWDNTWEFLRTKTPELSVVGTWWDPGHMITGYAARRVIADGAHCGFECMLTINDRITDLGKIFATNNENESIMLLRKYKGTANRVYWIASKDLIQKYQWLQYFGTGCDARVDKNCELYTLIPQTNVYFNEDGSVSMRVYGNIGYIDLSNTPIVFFTRGKNAALFKEIWYYENGTVQKLDLEKYNKTQIIESLNPIFRNMGYRLSSTFMPLTLWISEDKSYVVVIPESLKDDMFTKMFFLDGEGLKRFKLVYKNPEVRIYEVNFER